MKYISADPFLAIPLHSIVLPPLCFTVGTILYSWHYALFKQGLTRLPSHVVDPICAKQIHFYLISKVDKQILSRMKPNACSLANFSLASLCFLLISGFIIQVPATIIRNSGMVLRMEVSWGQDLISYSKLNFNFSSQAYNPC